MAYRQGVAFLAAGFLAVLVTGLCGPLPAEAADAEAAVGRILRGGKGGHCSGIVIAPDRALTAGHCVGNRSTWKPAGTRGLVLSLEGAEYRVTRITLSPASPFDGEGKVKDFRNDWAILELASPLGQPPLPVPYTGDEGATVAFVTRGPVSKIGWANGAKPEAERRFNAGCEIMGREKDGLLFLFRCGSGVGAGASGSALLAETKDGSAVVGIQSGQMKAKDGSVVGVAVVPPTQIVNAGG